jgi:hypothetical protein
MRAVTAVRAPLALGAAALLLSGCASLADPEAVCSRGEYPVWATENATGSACVRDGREPGPGYARYPAGKVPEVEGDRYDVQPNDPRYPWKAALFEQYPRRDCAHAVRRLGSEELTAAGDPRAARAFLQVRLDPAGDLCLRIVTPRLRRGVIVRSSVLTAAEQDVTRWKLTTTGSAGLGDWLRVGARGCLPVHAEVVVARGETLSRYAVSSSAGSCRG